MEVKKVPKPTIKVHEDHSEPQSRPKALHKKSEHLSVFRSASPSNSEHNFYLALPSQARSQGGRSLSAASLYNENGVPCPISDEKLLIK